MAEYFPYFIDMFIKLLLRIADIEAKVANVSLRKSGCKTFYTTTIVEFSEDIKLRFVIGLNEKIARKLANDFIGEEVKDEEIVFENTGEFANIVCGNISTKLQIMGIRTQISIPTVLINKDTEYFEYRHAEKAIVVPFVTTEGECEVQILVSGLEAYVSNKKRVLIVDDSKSVALKITKIVESLTDFEVVGHAKTAEEAIILYKEHMPDLVTMDIVLPDKSGLAAIKDLIQIDPEANIIVISSVGGSQDKLFQAIQCGAKNVVVKPFDDDTVREIFIQSV
jgi:two-component system chemotaxis response regulator CheY